MLAKNLAVALFVFPAVVFPRSPAPASAPARYVDAIDWPSREAGLQKFGLAEEMLNLSFERLCTDTFCDSDYQNLRPMQLSCSVDTSNATLKQCLWIFAGSFTTVNPESGAVQVSARVYRCKLRLARNTPVESFYETMHGGHLLNEKLPMARHTVYQDLLGCLP